MVLVNIGSDNYNDPFYRYKMPEMVIKIEGKGNGIKTKIVNIDNIAKALNRKTEDIMKFFAYEVGTTVVHGDLLNGQFQDLNGNLEEYINKYVLCDSCGNPETFFCASKKHLKTNCKACGQLNNVASNRFTDYMMKKLCVHK